MPSMVRSLGPEFPADLGKYFFTCSPNVFLVLLDACRVLWITIFWSQTDHWIFLLLTASIYPFQITADCCLRVTVVDYLKRFFLGCPCSWEWPAMCET